VTRREAQARRLVLLAYIAFNLVTSAAWLLIFGRRSPDLLKERLRPGPGAKEGLAQTFALYVLPWLGHYVGAALDVRRFHRPRPVPLRLQLAGLLGYAASFGVVLWAMTVNRFFSSVVRIQRERGQRVITDGPYRYVRHPGYAAAIPLLLSSALALGSWWALPPALVWAAAIIRRTLLEDRLLREELEGYAAYAERVPFRLVPGIW